MTIDDGFEPTQALTPGIATSNVEPEPSEFSDVRAVLWLIDPESRHGWREFYVRAPKPPKPGGKVGF